jgi:hypothetical protein
MTGSPARQIVLVTLIRDPLHRQPFPVLLNLHRDIEGVVSLVHEVLPCRPRTSFRRILQATLPAPSAFWDFSIFRPFLWDVWENRGYDPASGWPGLARFWLGRGCPESREPSVGFLAFPASFVGRVGKPGWGVRPRKPTAESPKAKDVILSAAKDLCIASRKPLWDFSLFQPFLWDVWENRGRGVRRLATRHSELGTGLPTCNLQRPTYDRFSPGYPSLVC